MNDRPCQPSVQQQHSIEIADTSPLASSQTPWLYVESSQDV